MFCVVKTISKSQGNSPPKTHSGPNGIVVSYCLIHIVPCDELPLPEHGSVICDYGDDGTASYQDVCRYTCVEGFELMGSSSRSCLSTGMWSNVAPTCIRGGSADC